VVGVTISEFAVAVWAFKVFETLCVTFMVRLGGIGVFVFQFEAAFRTELLGSIIHSDLTSRGTQWHPTRKPGIIAGLTHRV
jgi:hypothetical protein